MTHEKSLVVDSTYVLVATFNLSDKNFTETRDYGVVSYAVPGVEQQRGSRHPHFAALVYGSGRCAGWSGCN